MYKRQGLGIERLYVGRLKVIWLEMPVGYDGAGALEVILAYSVFNVIIIYQCRITPAIIKRFVVI